MSIRTDDNRIGDTALTMAATNGDFDIVKVLVELGADPSAEGGLPLSLAQRHGYRNIETYLKSMGARDAKSYSQGRY